MNIKLSFERKHYEFDSVSEKMLFPAELHTRGIPPSQNFAHAGFRPWNCALAGFRPLGITTTL